MRRPILLPKWDSICHFLIVYHFQTREGAATTIQHLARFDNERRHGSVVAVLLETMATLTDEILDLHDRFNRRPVQQSQAQTRRGVSSL